MMGTVVDPEWTLKGTSNTELRLMELISQPTLMLVPTGHNARVLSTTFVTKPTVDHAGLMELLRL